MSQKNAVILAFSVFVLLFVIGISMRIFLPKSSENATQANPSEQALSSDSITHAD